MMMDRRAQQEAAQRRTERLEREDAAPRLRNEVPSLIELRLEILESRHDGSDTTRHMRHIVIDRAPALFWLPCSEKDCQDGGHELTHTIMRSLRAATPRFEGQDVCRGRRGARDCSRELKFSAVATYRTDP